MKRPITKAFGIMGVVMVVAVPASFAEEGFKYRKLKPADPPCLFLLDENTGQPTGDPVNTPCVLGSSTVNPGDNVDPEAREAYGKAAEGPANPNASSKARDYNSSRSNTTSLRKSGAETDTSPANHNTSRPR